MMDNLIEWDVKLFLYLNNLGTPKFDSFWLLITNEYYWIPTYVFIFLVIWEKYGWKKVFMIGASIGIMIVLSDTTSSIFKNWIQRPRPCRNPELDGLFRLVIEKCRGSYCYFSAHAANSFALATYLSILFYRNHKYAPILLFSWALLVSYSRIYVGVHFPLDILTGTFMGILTGWIFAKTLKYIL